MDSKHDSAYYLKIEHSLRAYVCLSASFITKVIQQDIRIVESQAPKNMAKARSSEMNFFAQCGDNMVDLVH